MNQLAAVSVGHTRFTLQQVIDHAIGRCKIPRQKIGPEHQKIARDVTSLALSELSNKVTPLWCKERLFLGLYENVPTVELPRGTVDLLPELVFYRQAPRVGNTYLSAEGTPAFLGDSDLATFCAQTTTDGTMTVGFNSPTIVTYVGVIPHGDHFYNLVFEVSNDGVTWSVIQVLAPPYGQNATPYPDGVWAWYEVTQPPALGVSFFRVRETSGGVLDLRELYLCSQPYDVLMARLNEQQWGAMPNKRFPGRPLQFFLERNVDVNLGELCTLVLWPTPTTTDVFSSVFLVRKRYVADVQSFSDGLELPTRWYDAMIWWVASYMAAEYEEVPQEREVYLDQKADVEVGEALAEERDNSPITIEADISCYTR